MYRYQFTYKEDKESLRTKDFQTHRDTLYEAIQDFYMEYPSAIFLSVVNCNEL